MLLVIVLVGSTVTISAIRRSILRAAGWVLVINDRVEAADVIVLAYNDDFAGMLEAADLVHSGVATRVAIFADRRTVCIASSSAVASPTKRRLHEQFENSRR